jgi:Fe-S-cluster containining protein
MLMVFSCRQCGTCCMYMGDYITIEHRIGPFEFACESVSTGTPFIARVDEDKREIFLDTTFPDEHPAACRFLRPEGDLIRCTIHESSPCQCKFYRCVVMKIFNKEGAPIGFVNGNLSLHSDDHDLKTAWEEARQKVTPGADNDAEMQLQHFLEGRGYRVE